ncbi:MAG: hypothetical protein DME50_13145 [Verrucomicrobia bacterium]|nr:MAG: hypothetical protein DME50_13145 [Verrucomicrobiota bacterium]
MRRSVLVLLFCSAALVLAGCKKHETPPPVPRSQAEIDGCALLTKEETEAVQGSPIKETKSSARSDAAFLVSQCFYTATDFSKSVNLALMRRDPGRPTTTSPKDFWKERFGRYASEEKERDKHKEEMERQDEKEESVSPKKIDGIGEEAFWTSNRFGGILYVLKGDAFISISLGGTDDEETKIKKSKALAEKALNRL